MNGVKLKCFHKCSSCVHSPVLMLQAHSSVCNAGGRMYARTSLIQAEEDKILIPARHMCLNTPTTAPPLIYHWLELMNLFFFLYTAFSSVTNSLFQLERLWVLPKCKITMYSDQILLLAHCTAEKYVWLTKSYLIVMKLFLVLITYHMKAWRRKSQFENFVRLLAFADFGSYTYGRQTGLYLAHTSELANTIP